VSLGYQTLRFIEHINAREEDRPIAFASLTDEEIIARDMSDIEGNKFLFWDHIIAGGISARYEDLSPAQKKAQDIIDEHLNARREL
jgi:hypothetical protein